MSVDEKLTRYNEVIKHRLIKKDCSDGGVSISTEDFNGMKGIDWDILIEEIFDKNDPLRKLELRLRTADDGDVKSIDPQFIKFVKCIEDHTTLEYFSIDFIHIKHNIKYPILFEALKKNRSIKYFKAQAERFNFETACAFAPIFINNQTLISLDILLYKDILDHQPGDLLTEPIDEQSVLELGRALQTSAIQRLHFAEIDVKGFKTLASYLPKTLICLDISENQFDQDIIPILDSYLKSNGNTLKQLIVDDNIETSDLQEQHVTITHHSSLSAKLFRQVQPLILLMDDLTDNDWSKLVVELTKDDTPIHTIDLHFSHGFHDEHLKYLEIILGKQSQLKHLHITHLLDTSLQTELFRLMKDNTSIIKLRIDFEMDSKSFNALVDLLKTKTNLIELELIKCLNLTDDDAIKLADGLKSCTNLQHLIMEGKNQIGDNGFQALLSSLPNPLVRLIFGGSLITAKGLPSLLTFVKPRPALKELCIKKNGISTNTSTKINVPDLVHKIIKIAHNNNCDYKLDMNETVKQKIAVSIDGEVNLYKAKLQDDHILELCNEIKKNPNRNWSLDLGKNSRISSIGYGYLAEILSSTIPIVQLSVASNYMNNESKAILLRALSHKKTLQKIDLSHNKINNEHMEYIQHFIKDNSTLKEIEFVRCEMGYNGIVNLAKVLSNSTLETLDLTGNLFGDAGLAIVLESIPPTLTDLSLRENDITESSLEIILTFLRTNQTLNTLDLNDNPIYGENRCMRQNNKCYQQLQEASKQNGICELI